MSGYGWRRHYIENNETWNRFIKKEIDGGPPIGSFELPSSLFPVTVLVEEEYVDKDWSSLLSSFYSKLLIDHPRRGRRYHLFKGRFNSISDVQTVSNDDYYGFTTIYSSWPMMRGRTILKPSIFYDNARYCLCKQEINVWGRQFFLNAFPATGQDARYISCAHAALWTMLRFFSDKYSYYREVYHSDIVNSNTLIIGGRQTPTSGLFGEQILQIVNSFNLTPVLHRFAPQRPNEILDIITDYLVAGLPVLILAYPKGPKKPGHAVTAVGLTGQTDYRSPGEPLLNSRYFLVNRQAQKIIVNDDNEMPYGVIDASPVRTKIKPLDIKFACIPLYPKIMFERSNALMSVKEVLENSAIGLETAKRSGWVKRQSSSLIVRLVLTSSRSYKKHLFRNNSDSDASLLMRMFPMPKFVWVAECRFQNASSDSDIACEIVIDATASKRDPYNMLYVRYPAMLICFKRWCSRGRRPEVTFEDIDPSDNPRPPFLGNLVLP